MSESTRTGPATGQRQRGLVQHQGMQHRTTQRCLQHEAMRRRAVLLPVLLAALLMLVASGAAAAPRVVAVGDVHGSHDGLVTILRTAGLVDSSLAWSGGDTILVQTGDLLDRGVEVREVLDLLMRLQGEAVAAGGRVEVLLGNHEAMNLLGLVRDVNPQVLARFADAESEARRRAAFQEFKRVHQHRADLVGVAHPLLTGEVEARWMRAHPPGLLEYLAAFGPDGVYGRWLRRCPVVLRLGTTLFVHGGVSAGLLGMEPDEVNRVAAEQLARFDSARADLVGDHLVEPLASIQAVEAFVRGELAFAGQHPAAGGRARLRLLRARRLAPLADWTDWLVMSADGPLWFRGAARWDEATYRPVLETVQRECGIDRVVSGHTVQSGGRIVSRLEGRVLLIDTGMLAGVYGGRPSALELDGGTVTAIYPDSRQVLVRAATTR
jgi:hypothetical protein